MPAPSNAALLDYEKNYEDALATYLATAITGSPQILTPRTTIATASQLSTPRIGVRMSITGTGQLEQWRTTDGKVYEAWKAGSLELVCVARRDASGQALGDLRGGCRVALLEATAALNSTTLPYYETKFVVEEGSTPATFGDNDEISCTLRYGVQFVILPNQWV
jgi:hypothetical protein